MKNERDHTQNTIPLYETNGSLSVFDATVINCYSISCGGKSVYGLELDKTAFFPEGGGQPGDEGWLDYTENAGSTLKSLSVFDTQYDDEGRILHYTNEPVEVGTKVVGRLNWPVRLSRMQNHGAEHLLCGIIHERFGYENNGFHISDEGVIFDVDGPLSKEQISDVEKAANEVVYKNLPITISFPSPDEAKELEYRSKLDTFENIRLVTIENTDVCACCAPQLDSTGQIGIVKIIDFMPHRQGTRMTLVAGADAYEDYVYLHEENARIMAALSSKRDTTSEFVNASLSRFSALKEENTSLKNAMVELTARVEIDRINKRRRAVSENANICDGAALSMNGVIPECFGFKSFVIDVVFCEINDTVALRNLVNTCIKECGNIIAGFCKCDGGYNYIIGKSDDCEENILPELAKTINKLTGGRGGGSVKMVQGSMPSCDLNFICKQLQM